MSSNFVTKLTEFYFDDLNFHLRNKKAAIRRRKKITMRATMSRVKSAFTMSNSSRVVIGFLK